MFADRIYAAKVAVKVLYTARCVEKQICVKLFLHTGLIVSYF